MEEEKSSGLPLDSQQEQLHRKSETIAEGNHLQNKKKPEKVSFYLTIEQVNKLDDLAYQYKKRIGKRVNRNDIVRYLIDQATIEQLEGW